MSYSSYRYSLRPGEETLSESVGTPSMEMSSGGSPESSLAAAGAMKANPYLLGASFLMSYLKAKQDQFEKKKQQEMQIAANYGADQEQAMNSLNNSWKSALLK